MATLTDDWFQLEVEKGWLSDLYRGSLQSPFPQHQSWGSNCTH